MPDSSAFGVGRVAVVPSAFLFFFLLILIHHYNHDRCLTPLIHTADSCHNARRREQNLWSVVRMKFACLYIYIYIAFVAGIIFLWHYYHSSDGSYLLSASIPQSVSRFCYVLSTSKNIKQWQVTAVILVMKDLSPLVISSVSYHYWVIIHGNLVGSVYNFDNLYQERGFSGISSLNSPTLVLIKSFKHAFNLLRYPGRYGGYFLKEATSYNNAITSICV